MNSRAGVPSFAALYELLVGVPENYGYLILGSL